MKNIRKTMATSRAQRGRIIWGHFTNVIILDEQMRQASDPEFSALLRRAREGNMSSADYDLIMSKRAQTIDLASEDRPKVITKLNAYR